MKQGRTLQELAAELQRQADSKRDYLSPAPRISMDSGGLLSVGDTVTLPATDHAHGQVASWLGVPKAYYDRMRAEAPELLANNVNHWLGRRDEQRLVRTLDGQIRAVLSNRYRRIDNIEIAEAILPILAEVGAVVQSSEITPRRLYIKATLPTLRREVEGSVRVGDLVEAGVAISNSEVGLGALHIDPLLYFLVCLNGMIRGEAMRKYHVGRRADDSEEVYEVLTDETRKADDKALMLKARDVMRAAFDVARFESAVRRLAQTTQERLEKPQAAVEAAVKVLTLPSTTTDGVLKHLIEGGDLSRYGLSQAITATANDWEDYEGATELEKAGGKVIDLPPSDWKQIAAAV